MIVVWPLLRMLGLRAASAGLGMVISPAGWVAIAGAAALGALVWFGGHERDIGRDQERAAAAQASAEAEARALKAALQTIERRDKQEAKDNTELAAKDEAEKKVRDENPGDAVLWRSDDGWLRAKRTAGRRR